MRRAAASALSRVRPKWTAQHVARRWSSASPPIAAGGCSNHGGGGAFGGHEHSGDLLGIANEHKAMSKEIPPPIVVKGDDFSTFLRSAEHMFQEDKFGEAWGFSSRALLVDRSGRGRRIKPWERGTCYVLRAEVLLGMGAPRRALSELQPAKDLLSRGSASKWPPEVLERIEIAEATMRVRRASDDEVRRSAEEAKVPVTVITGFLGSGKTTLLNRILTEQHGKRIAVIENEFGAVGVDAALVERSGTATEAVVEMSNGCICCTLLGDFVEGMQRVLKDVAARGRKLDAVIVETTGLADPSAIAATFFVEESMRESFRLDSVVGVCDGKNLLDQLAQERGVACVNEASEQAAFADVLLLTKIDMCTKDGLDSVLRRLRQVNPFAKIIPMNLEDRESPLPLDQLCDVRSFSLERALEFDSSFLDADDSSHQHDSSIRSVGVRLRGALNQQRVNLFVDKILKRYPKTMYRMKGILDVAGMEERFVFHSVSGHFGGMPQDPWQEDEKRESRAVFIGREIDEEWLLGGLRTCFEDPSAGVLETNVAKASANMH